MKKSIEMPEVLGCGVETCVYNADAMCHARAITVGDTQKHICDTMTKSERHTHRRESGGVGACLSTNCAHNEDWECQADGINVTLSGGEATCGTFSQR